MKEERKQSYFTLRSQSQNKEWKMDIALLNCSLFLSELQLEQHSQNCFTITLPESIEQIVYQIQLINTFYCLHNFDKQSIQVQKIGLRKDHPFMDPISSQFTNNYLINLADNSLKKLLQISQYLKLDGFKNVLCVYIASKYYFYHNEDRMKKELAANNIFYSRQMEVNLKKEMSGYAKQFSKDLLESYRKKNQKKQ